MVIAENTGYAKEKEVDFVAQKGDRLLYIQTTYTLADEQTARREYASLESIRDNYEKIVLSLAPGLDSTYDGIKSFNLIDWLLS